MDEPPDDDTVSSAPPGAAALKSTVSKDLRWSPGQLQATDPDCRTNLPPTLRHRYVAERNLVSGDGADLLLVRDRETGEPAVVRLFHRDVLPVDESMLESLSRADRHHLLGLLEWGSDDGSTWEVLEYAPGGSLKELLRARPGPWPPQTVQEVLNQLLPTLEYLHSLRIVHCDIEPASILVRSTEPLDLVLAGIGLTTFFAGAQVRQTTSHASAYAAPEAATGNMSTGLDWWSVGIVLVELLTGRHPFQRPDGSWMDDMLIARKLIFNDVDLSMIADERWRLLCRGLLCRAPEGRWGAAEIRQWCAGGAPALAEPQGPAFTFAGAVYTTPQALADAFRQRWSDGRRLLAGQRLDATQLLALQEWTGECGLTAFQRPLDQPFRPDRAVAQVVRALDPTGPAVVQGRRVDQEHLLQLANEAMGEAGPARALLDVLYQDGILAVLDDLPGCSGYALLDSQWRRLVDDFVARANALSLPLSAESRSLYRAMLLLAAVPGEEEALAPQAAEAAADPDAQAQPWFAHLARENLSEESRPAHHAILLHAAPLAAGLTTRQRPGHELQVAETENSRVRSTRLGSPLAAARQRTGRTQREVAERMGLSQARVSAIESGNIETTEIATLINYAQAIDASLRISFAIGNVEQPILDTASRLTTDRGGNRNSDEEASKPFLTSREHEILLLWAEGATPETMTKRLQISARTIAKHKERISRKLGAPDQIDTILRARQLGLLSTQAYGSEG
ncbi:protein kinase domain-containing protein [Micromonospora sp. LOL_023]|uniref:protein kinase domain-containing protein n=1 Tax=Micromonospora sp. LOL_023 TaxID=3345418 RepID=UPI003A88BAF2